MNKCKEIQNYESFIRTLKVYLTRGLMLQPTSLQWQPSVVGTLTDDVFAAACWAALRKSRDIKYHS